MLTGNNTEKDYFTHLFEQHHRSLYAYAYKKTGDSFTAEEIAQSTFIKFWQYRLKAGTLIQDNPEKLLFFITKALLVDYYRKKTATISIEEAFTVTESVASTYVLQHEALHFNNLIRSVADTLPDRQKQVFEMNYFQEMNHGEIAMALNISRQTVKNQLSKAMKQVRKLVTQQFLSTMITFL
ncbi:RNA polymerase sigma factor [Chitinophaga defluvii]|uniref:Sigma-70 family RNA polymerase sigma factor n=1 Tax=Chitinophaga defluvii TaxID=3163343 RepID=A0ABV2T1V0_9BACT